MDRWKPIFSQGGYTEARRCYNSEGEEIHIIVYQHVGKHPRHADGLRVVGIGKNRREAQEDAVRAIDMWDAGV